MDTPRSLYVHIPFCASICGYCDFCKLIYSRKFAQEYVPTLVKEVGSFSISKVDTIYVGGGTPTSLDDDLFEEVLKSLSPLLSNGGEFTVEANPESLSEAKLLLMKKYGVNRLSIGIESTHKKHLLAMGRKHSYEDAVEAVDLAKRYGFTNINVDLIYALPNESEEELKEDIKALLALEVPHISTYSLILEDNSIYGVKGLKEAEEDVQADQYELILKDLRESGYERYEVSNFSKPGYESRHNITYWKDEEYYGCGLGASGYVKGVRYTNTKSLSKYLKGEIIDSKEVVEKEDDMFYFLLTNLRLKDGFLKKYFENRFELSFDETYKQKVNKPISEGLLIITEDRVRVTDKGMLQLDRVLVNLE